MFLPQFCIHNSVRVAYAIITENYKVTWTMARIHQNGRRARAGKVGQLPHIILWRNRFVRRKMPSHANCVVPGCPNRKDHCKWDLFPSEEDVQGRKAYVKRRLCGSTLNKVGCGNTSPSCKSVLFHRLPKDVGAFHLWFTASLIVYNIVAGSHLNRLDESSLK